LTSAEGGKPLIFNFGDLKLRNFVKL